MNLRISSFLISVLFALATKAAPPVEEGKSIFAARCAACHNINKVLTGPALAGVDQRRSIDWIVSFVHSSQTLVAKGDTAAVALFTKFNRIPMPDHPDLDEGQIKSIVEYIKTEAASPGAEKTKATKVVAAKPTLFLLLTANTGFVITVAALLTLLIAVLLFAVQVKKYERRVAASK